MKTKLLGIVALALGLSAVGCAARGYARYGPPPPPPPPREAMVRHSHDGRVWVSGQYRWNGRRYVWVEGHWVKPHHRGEVWMR